ncbi:PDZ domain-containing protein [Mesorhizobium onobrychidis]|uniref:PDZ domain-containing protein n=1 Tax=Mesorhizobium onobrychidis TaxID=2775404 RepID=UPI0028683305|nr:PDZ domain-containing protein [Mesorhizobium onobrychidis]
MALTIGQRSDEEEQTGAVPGPEAPDQRLGLSLSPISDEARQQLGLQPGTAGLFVQEVAPNSLADQNGLRAGDVIVSANNRDVTQPSDIQEEWTKSRQQNKPMLFRINRQGQSLFVAWPRPNLDWPDLDENALSKLGERKLGRIDHTLSRRRSLRLATGTTADQGRFVQ